MKTLNSVCPAWSVERSGDQKDVSHQPWLDKDGKPIVPVHTYALTCHQKAELRICCDCSLVFAVIVK